MAEFHETLFGCASDMTSCLIGLCVPCGIVCLQAQAVKTATGDDSAIGPYCIGLCLGAIGGAINRGTIRRSLNMSGSFIGDCCTWCFCPACSACQEFRETKKR